MSKIKKTDSKIKLTITMLVSNRIDTIRKCMDSINPILKQVSSEMIVVDTGSNDGSIDVVKEYTNLIVNFPWCNDFSAARNAGLKRAGGEWIMFLDDDEWFEDVTEIIDFFNSGEYKKYNLGAYIARNYTSRDGSSWSDSNAVRMAKRTPELQFKGKIHEVLSPVKGPVKYFKAYVNHYGYIFTNKGEARKHSRRNITLIEQELRENPWDARVHAQAVQEYYGVEENYKVIELCSRMLKKYGKTEVLKVYLGYFGNYLLRAYIALRDWEQAYECGCALLEKKTTMIAYLGNVREMIKICKASEKYGDAVRYMEEYLALYDKLQDYPDRNEIFLDLSRYLQPAERESVLLEGIALGGLSKRPEITKICIQKFDWEKKSLVLYEDTVDYVMEYLSDAQLQPWHYKFFHKILQKPFFCVQIEKIWDKYREDKKKYANLLSLFADSREENFFVRKNRFYYHMCYACDWTDKEAAQELEKLWNEMSNPLLMEEELWKLIEKYHLDMEKLIQSIPYFRWFSLVRTWVGQEYQKDKYTIESPKEDLGNIDLNSAESEFQKKCRILGMEEKRDLRADFLNLKCQEYSICKNKAQKEEDILSEIESYTKKAMTFFTTVYNPFVFQEENIMVLPPEGVFAFYMDKALDDKREGKILEYSRMLKEAGKAHPVMKNVCKQLLKLAKKGEAEEKNSVKAEMNEFTRLGEMIKEKIRVFILKGEYEAAKQTLEQLKVMLPEDLELSILEKQLL